MGSKMSDGTILLILIVIVVIFAIFFVCDKKEPLSFFDQLKQNLGLKRDAVPPATPKKKVTFASTTAHTRSTNMLQVEHNDPLLVTLFSRDIQLLPDGMSQEQFDGLVNDYHEKNLKVKEVVIPRSVNFNFEKYTAEQELMNQNVKEHYQQFTSREVIGGISDSIARGVVAPTVMTAEVPAGLPAQVRLQPRTFNKKVAKR